MCLDSWLVQGQPSCVLPPCISGFLRVDSHTVVAVARLPQLTAMLALWRPHCSGHWALPGSASCQPLA